MGLALLAAFLPAAVPRPAQAGILGGTMWVMDTGGTITQYDLSSNSRVGSFSATTEIGRGLAFDATSGNLWFSALIADVAGDPTTYHGDGVIHKVTPTGTALPTIPDPTSRQSTSITRQGVGALSMDPDGDGSLWAASLWTDANNSFHFYHLTSAGAFISECAAAKVQQVNNHNLKVTRIGGSKVILSELALSGPTIYSLDATSCSPVTTYTLPVTGGFTGMDIDSATGDLIGTDEISAFNVGKPPFGANLGSFALPATPAEGLTLKQDFVPTTISGSFCTTPASALALVALAASTTGLTAQIFSGSVLVASVPVVNGSWSLTGAAPNAFYTVQYVDANGNPLCSASIQTDAFGNGTAGVATPPPDKGNHHWTTAAAPGGVDGVTLTTDFLLGPNESDWYAVNVGPGEQVVVSLQTPSVPVGLYLYRDLQQEVDFMKQAVTAGTVDPHALSASLGAAQSAPFDQGPFDQGPFDQGPFDQGPFDQGPFDQGPFDQGPFDQGPFDQGSLDPAPFDQGPFDQGAYMTAQQRALVAYSARRGASPLLVVRNTWDRSGRWYIRFVGLNGVYDQAHPITFTVKVTDNGCGSLNMTPATLTPSTATVSAARTVILTNTAQVTATNAGDATALMTRLNKFKTDHPELGIQVVDLNADANIQQNYSSWLAHPSCAAAANVVANSIHRLLDLYNQAGSLEYVVLAGGDRVVPFWRVPDESALGHEHNFSPPVQDVSTSQATLRQDFFLSQDFYASFRRISRPSHDLYLPSRVSVGRLVENVTEMTKMLDAYDASGGVLQPHRALVTGYSGLARLASDLGSILGTAGLNVDSLIEDPAKGPADPSAWTADQLRKLMIADPANGTPAPRHDILALEGHFSAIGALAADYRTAVYSSELLGLTNPNLQNTLVLSNGCHSLYNVTNFDAVNASVAQDWAETFAGNGMTSVGGTGYQYFDSDLVLLTSAILDGLTAQLTFDPNPGGVHTPVPIGKALNAAKLNYADSLVGMEGTAEKSMGELSLFGLPFWSVDVLNRKGASGLVSWFSLDPSAGAGVTANLLRPGFAIFDTTPGFTLNEQDLSRQVIDATGTVIGTNVDSYFNAGQPADVWASPYRPVLPQKAVNVHAANLNGFTARGAVLVSSDYTDVTTNGAGTAFRPYVEVPSTEFGGLHPHFESSVFAPLQPAYLNDLVGESLHVLPMQYRSARDSAGNLLETGTARKLSNPVIRVYYSSSTDAGQAFAGPPSIAQVRVRPSTTAGSVHVEVIVTGPASVGLDELLITYTTAGGSHWASCSLIGGDGIATCGTPVAADLPQPAGSNSYLRRYSSDFASPTGAAGDVQLYVQAVSGTGIPTADTNAGNYYTADPTTLANPKVATQLKLQGLPTGAVAYHSLIGVSAVLTARGAPVAGKLVTFTLGGTRVVGTTDSSGTATPPHGLPANVEPSQYLVQAAFAEDAGDLASGDLGTVNVVAATAGFANVADTSVQYSDQVALGSLTSGSSQLDGRTVVIDIGSGRKIGALTNEKGQAILDTRTFDGQPIAPGAYVVQLTYNNPGGAPYDDRFTSASVSLKVTVTPETGTIHFNNPGPTVAGSSTTLAAQVSQQADGSLGDLRLASINYTLTPDSGSAPVQVNSVAVNQDGSSSTAVTLPVGGYTVAAAIGPTGGLQWFAGGLDATSTTRLTVGYAVCALYDQTKAVQSGGTVPIKIELCDASGRDLSQSTIVVTATGVTKVSTNAPGTLADSGSSNPDNNFRFDSTLGSSGGYIYNLSTKGLTTGTYAVTFTASGDPTTHSVQFQVK